MSKLGKGEPAITFDQLLDALDGCGQAVGFALCAALRESGTDRDKLIGIARSLGQMSQDERFGGPSGHCMGGLVYGMLRFLEASTRNDGGQLLP